MNRLIVINNRPYYTMSIDLKEGEDLKTVVDILKRMRPCNLDAGYPFMSDTQIVTVYNTVIPQILISEVE